MSNRSRVLATVSGGIPAADRQAQAGDQRQESACRRTGLVEQMLEMRLDGRHIHPSVPFVHASAPRGFNVMLTETG